MTDFVDENPDPLEEVVFSETVVDCRLCNETVSTDQPHLLALGVGRNARAGAFCSWPVFTACPRCASRLERLADEGVFTERAWKAFEESAGI